MFKYFLIGFICLLLGFQLFYIAKALFITPIPSVLLIMLGFSLMLGTYIKGASDAKKESATK